MPIVSVVWPKYSRRSVRKNLPASIAHEINQPLGAILTNAETVKAILKSPSPDIAELNEIVDDILHDDRAPARSFGECGAC
jgi:signal transduction histidine kinase